MLESSLNYATHYPLVIIFTSDVSYRGMGNLYLYSISAIVMSFIVFLLQNVIFSKFLDSLEKSYDLRFIERVEVQFNKAFLYPYTLAMLMLYYIFLFRVDGCTTFFFTINYQFSVFKGVVVPLSFSIDDTTLRFILTTMSIGLATNSMAVYYMKNEIHQQRFYNLLNSFLFSMLLLLLSNNLLSLILFWEMIGLFSYFLINFLNKKPRTFKSASKAIVNY